MISSGHTVTYALCVRESAPARGARICWGRGCQDFFSRCLVFALLCVPTLSAAQSIPVPSGQIVTLNEVLIDEEPGETWVRFRFVAPEIARPAGTVDSEIASSDMDHLCEALVVPYVQDYALQPKRVVISMSDRPVAFGDADPGVVQFFEAYRLENTRCIWEGF